MGQFGSMGGQITGAFGGSGPKYRGYRPQKSNLQFYESRQKQDIEGLYGEDPYGQPGLGYSDATLQKIKGLQAGDLTAEKQKLYDLYAGKKGAYGARSAEYAGAQAGMARGQRESGMRQATEIGVRGEDVARQDWQRRHGALTGAYQTGTDLYNAYAQNKYQADLNRFQEKKNRYAAVGMAAGGAMDFAFSSAQLGTQMGTGGR
jgi:hypothetical protein